MFEELDYDKYFLENKLDERLGLPKEKCKDIVKKKPKNFDKTNPFPAELDDLTRLHYLIRKRKVRTVLEFGVGKSTIIIADALKKNKKDFGSKNDSPESFKVYSVDNIEHWFNICNYNIPDDLRKYVRLHFSRARMKRYKERFCSFYDTLPSVNPDFIYLDAPDPFSVIGNWYRILLPFRYKTPMAGDLFLLEPKLKKGTFILVDGRGGNSLYLKKHFKRNWKHLFLKYEDHHLFELIGSEHQKPNFL